MCSLSQVTSPRPTTVVPIGLAQNLSEIAGEHIEWEEFSSMRLAAGGDLRKYYPLSARGEAEYKEWRKPQRQH
jgi:hypothetical protein